MFHVQSCFWLFFLYNTGVETTLQWPHAYHFKATLNIPSANLVEPYEVWSNGFNGHRRFDFYQGMPRMYQKRLGVVNNYPQFQYYWVRPESSSVTQNKTACYQLKNTSSEVKMLSHYLPPMYNFVLKGPDVNQTTKWEYSYIGQKYGALYVYALWTIGGTDDWIPVRYEYRMVYKGLERDFIQHIYENFNRTKPDTEVYLIPSHLQCKMLTTKYSEEGLGSNIDFMEPILQYNMTEIFETFQVTHNRLYKTNDEHFTRFTVFLENYRYIQSVNRQQGSYKLGLNQFSDLTEDELLKLKGGIKVVPETFESKHSFQDSGNDEDDTDFDWRWYDAVSPVKDQTFLCGGCYAFATAAVVESAAYISKGCKYLVEVSEQAIIDCSRGPNGTGNQGCNGGYLYASFRWVKKNGIPFRKDYGPYLAMDGYCKLGQTWTSRLKINNYTKLPNDIKSIKEGLRQHGPLAALMHVPHSLFYHISGIYDDKSCLPDKGVQTHAVVIVGYGMQDDKRYWIIKNSWGSQWSDQGYFKLDMENNLCGITNVVYAVVDPQSLVNDCGEKYRDRLPLPDKGVQTHAVVIVGYGMQDDKRYWIIKNSWGSQWSDQGYFKLDMENNLCGITNVVYAVVDPQSLVNDCGEKYRDRLP